MARTNAALPFGLLLLALACAPFSACGSDAPTFGDYLTDTGTTDAGGDTVVLPDIGPACETSADCSGGEVCRGGVCREVCSDEEACEGAFSICEPTSGLCVQCLGDADCGGAPCVENFCAQVECVEDADCSGGFACDNFECVEIDASCEAGDLRCRGARVEICDSGSWTLDEDCGDLTCVDVGDGPACQDLVCTPGERTCDGGTLRACNDEGTVESAVACGDLPSCASAPFGCTCDVDACVERVCRPGSVRCDGEDVVTCVGSGVDEVVTETCSGDEFCQAGECLSANCTPGDVRCAGDTLLTCDLFGGWTQRDCPSSDSYCDAGRGECVEWACTPGTRQCSANQRAVLVCDDRGTASTRTDCGADEYCRAGTCLPQICEPSSTFCVEGDAYACDATGGSVELLDSCSASETCVDGACVGAGGCSTSADCPVPASSCSGATLVQYSASNGRCVGGSCDYASVTTRTDCSRFDQVCDPGPPARCASSTCTNDSQCGGDVCVGGVCVECRNAGDCGSNAWCDSNRCVDCGCAPGETCIDGGTCVGGSADDCSSDAECQGLAEAAGYTGTDAACSSRGRCYIIGVCGESALGGTAQFDPFNAACPAGLSCVPVIDLGGGFGAFNACGPCSTDGDCREGEVCTDGLLGLTDPYCGAEGGGFPFPFP